MHFLVILENYFYDTRDWESREMYASCGTVDHGGRKNVYYNIPKIGPGHFWSWNKRRTIEPRDKGLISEWLNLIILRDIIMYSSTVALQTAVAEKTCKSLCFHRLWYRGPR